MARGSDRGPATKLRAGAPMPSVAEKDRGPWPPGHFVRVPAEIALRPPDRECVSAITRSSSDAAGGIAGDGRMVDALPCGWRPVPMNARVSFPERRQAVVIVGLEPAAPPSILTRRNPRGTAR